MTWIASTLSEQRAQLGRFLLGTGNIGGIAMTTGSGIGLSDDEGTALIDRAVRAGFTVIDTADIYTAGASERVVGEWARAHPDSEILVQSKTGVTPDGPNLAPERIREQLARSASTLGHVDLYLAHAVDSRTSWDASLPVFSESVDDGTITAYGLSNVTVSDLAAALESADRLGLHRPEIVQNSYSLLSRQDDGGVLRIVQAEGLAYTPYSPLANGVLAGRYSNGERPARGSRAQNSPRSKAYLSDSEVMERVRRFDRLAGNHGISPAGLALAWLVNHPAVTAPVVALSKESHWDAIGEAGDVAWSAEFSDALDELFPA